VQHLRKDGAREDNEELTQLLDKQHQHHQYVRLVKGVIAERVMNSIRPENRETTLALTADAASVIDHPQETVQTRTLGQARYTLRPWVFACLGEQHATTFLLDQVLLSCSPACLCAAPA
jgi:hypothetical protein